MRSSSGVRFEQRPTMQELTKTLFPEPVVPATSRCGSSSRPTIIESPLTATPKGSGSASFVCWKPSSSMTVRSGMPRRFGFGISMPT